MVLELDCNGNGKEFDQFENSQKTDFFSPKRPIFLHVCASLSVLLSNLSTILLASTV